MMLDHLPHLFHLNQRVVRATFYTLEEFLDFSAKLVLTGFSVLYWDSPLVESNDVYTMDDVLALYYEELYDRPEGVNVTKQLENIDFMNRHVRRLTEVASPAAFQEKMR